MRARMFGLAALGLACGSSVAAADNLDWSVVNPFRFYQDETSFNLHRDAYAAIVKANDGVAPAGIVEHMELRMNAAPCLEAFASNYKDCAAHTTIPDDRKWHAARLGWAAGVMPKALFCYGAFGIVDQGSKQQRLAYPKDCMRAGLNGLRKESYITPTEHDVRAQLAAAAAAPLKGKTCVWSWTPRGSAAPVLGTLARPCDGVVGIARVPYPAGVTLTVKNAAGAKVGSADIAVSDVLVVGLGDSFASGEGNPDMPVTFDPRGTKDYGIGFEGYPIRYTKAGLTSDRIDANAATYMKADARWISRDCHRSQYSYQFRAALQLAVENPHRAVTLVHLACTGAEATKGVFGTKEAREPGAHGPKDVLAQLDQLLDLLCVSRTAAPHFRYTMQTPVSDGDDTIVAQQFAFRGCKDGKRKRDIDTLMLSLGGNDIGFASLVGYAIMQDQSSIALIMAMAGDLFFAPKDHYLPMLDTRMAAAGKAFSELLGVAPSNVLHTGYERFQVNAQDNLCSGGAGLDVHKNFGFIDSRIGEVDVFARKFFDRLECLDNGHKCAAGVAQTSGFNFVATPADRFKGRGICAALAEEREAFHTPRTSPDGFKPYMPHLYLPYAHKRRLFVSPSDAYMTANSHDLRPGCHASTRCQLSSDLTQLGFAALYSGAFHRTAEAHAIVADEVLKRVRPHLLAAGK